jgi:hypothetical protein
MSSPVADETLLFLIVASSVRDSLELETPPSWLSLELCIISQNSIYEYYYMYQ